MKNKTNTTVDFEKAIKKSPKIKPYNFFFVINFVFTLLLGFQSSWAWAQQDKGYYAYDDCFECHQDSVESHEISEHKAIPCLECHKGAEQEDHETVQAKVCIQCHDSHGEILIHETRFTCESCHVTEITHNIRSGKNCEKCHFAENTSNAPSMVLPQKGLICMPCHAAEPIINDRTGLISLIFFLSGMLFLICFWISGKHSDDPLYPHDIFKKNPILDENRSPGLTKATKLLILLKILMVDVILLKKLFKTSPKRWIIHSLIFYPLFLRFLLGVAAFWFAKYQPSTDLTFAMLDKNSEFSALFRDITGLLMLSGAIAATLRKRSSHLSLHGRTFPALIVLILVIGFVLEGMRLAIGDGDHQGYFIGKALSLGFKNIAGLQDLYGYVWYGHTIFTGIFIALIPFTRMSHIIIAPFVLLSNTWKKKKTNKNHAKK